MGNKDNKDNGYTMLKNELPPRKCDGNSLEEAAIRFIRKSCKELRFRTNKNEQRFEKELLTDIEQIDCSLIDFKGDIPKYKDGTEVFDGTSIKKNQIPYNMEKDIDRLCLENAIARFLKSGKKEDAFDVYFCYLEMFVGDYEKTRRMIELLSEFEANGSGLLMKHRDHYSHSVYVFTLGLAIYESNENFRKTYKEFYNIENDTKAAHHYLQYWGLTSLFHDIGYPFELPFEQVQSYFDVGEDDKKEKEKKKRDGRPFLAYKALDQLVKIDGDTRKRLFDLFTGKDFSTTDELFAYLLADKLGNSTYKITEEYMRKILEQKATEPDEFNYYMDHAYFSATVLFKKLFSKNEMDCKLTKESLDSITAILMHNSLYKFKIANYKADNNTPFKASLHPLAFMLMLCDELQCWDRTAYGRDSKKELHPMGCTFDFSDNQIKAVYLFDEDEVAKIDAFKDAYIEWLQKPKDNENSKDNKAPKLKAYSEMYIKKNGISNFQADIERIVDLTDSRLSVETGIVKNVHEGNRSYLSSSNFINLYNFAIVLNGRWQNGEWKEAKEAGQEEKFLSNTKIMEKYTNSFKDLSLEYKLSNINQAKSFARYMNEIGCFYTDKEVDFDLVKSFSEEELLKIGFLEHQRWLQEHYDMGWMGVDPDEELSKAERDFYRKHKDMIPKFDIQFPVNTDDAKKNYERLDQDEKDKDTDPMECMLALLRMYDGLRIYKL